MAKLTGSDPDDRSVTPVAPIAATTVAPAQEVEASAGGREIVFITAGIGDDQTLAAEFGDNVEVVVLDAAGDGVSQIVAALKNSGGEPYSAVHIISHGSDGQLDLGETVLSEDTLSDYTAALESLRDNLTEDADILLYGCDVAATEKGTAFIRKLADLTGADVAASDDLTGSALAGGDSLLEVATGAIETEIVVSQAAWDVSGVVLAENPLPVIPEEFQNIIDYIVADFENDVHGNWPLFVSEYGDSAVITYSFMETAPEEQVYLDYGDTQFFEFDTGSAETYENTTIPISGQKDAVRRILATVSSFTNVEFVEVTGDSGREGQIRFANTEEDTSAFTLFGDDFRDVWISGNYPYSGEFDNTSYAYNTLLHEIYHALGLNHPGPYNGTADASEQIFDSDNLMYTQMSYFARPNGWQIWGVDLDGTIYVEDANGNYMHPDGEWYEGRIFTGPAFLDVAALQSIYGVKDVRTGDTEYIFYSIPSFDDFDYRYVLQSGDDYDYLSETGASDCSYGIQWGGDLQEYVTIIDSGGNDTFNFVNNYGNVHVNLADGQFWSSGGNSGYESDDYYSISFGTEIENVVTGRGWDVVLGNDLDNIIETNAGQDHLIAGFGDDILKGGTGDDSYRFSLYGWGHDTIIDEDHDATIDFQAIDFEELTVTVLGMDLHISYSWSGDESTVTIEDYLSSHDGYHIYGAGDYWLMPILEDDKTIDVTYNDGSSLSIRTPFALSSTENFTIKVEALPEWGTVKLSDGGFLQVGSTLTVEELLSLNFISDVDFFGDAGSFEYSITNSNSRVTETAYSSISFNVVRPDNFPPKVDADKSLEFDPNSTDNPLGISAPTDLDDNMASIIVSAVPDSGEVRSNGILIESGDVLTVDQLTSMTYTPNGFGGGDAGVFSYVVEDAEGATATQVVTLRVDAGDIMSEASSLGNLTNDSWSCSGKVGAGDTSDFYTFTLDQISDFDLSLSGLSANADVIFYGTQLVWNKRTKSYVETLATLNYERTAGAADETISRGLTAGTYYVQVTGGDTDYELSLSAANLPENGSGNTMGDSLDLGDLSRTSWIGSDWVGSMDTEDFYSFTLDQVSEIDLTLYDLSANADVTLYGTQLVYNKKTKSYVETLATLNSLRTAGVADEILSRNLGAGTYYVQVSGVSDTEYSLSLFAEDLPENGSGNTMDDALDLGILNDTHWTDTDWLGAVDTDDFYTFTLDQLSAFRLNVDDFLSDIDVFLYGTQLVYNKKTKQYEETLATLDSRVGRTHYALIQHDLAAGTYYVQVSGGDSEYELSLLLENRPENGSGNTMDAALDLGNMTDGSWSGEDWLCSADTDDYYTFTLDQVSTFDLDLTDLSTRADVFLYGTQQVYNKKTKQYDEALVELASGHGVGTNDERLHLDLASGTYYVHVEGYGNGRYTLDLDLDSLPENGSGNTMDAALDLGNLTDSTYSGSDWVGSVDTDDFYTFTLDQVSNFDLTLSGMSADADVTFYGTQLIYNKKTKSYVETLATLNSERTLGRGDETISRGLAAGTYYVQVTGGDTEYDLDLTAVNLPENGSGNTMDDALDLGNLTASTFTDSDWIGSVDTDDFYTFTLDQISSFSLDMSGLDNNADVMLYGTQLVYNKKTKQYVEALTTLDYLRTPGTADESLSRGLAAGTYYVQVTGGDTEYTLDLAAENLPENGSGDGWADALDAGTITTDGTEFNDWVGALDGCDCYRFYLAGPTSSFTLILNGESWPASVAPALTMQDSAGNVVYSYAGGGSGFSDAWMEMGPGYYLISVRPVEDTAYRLNISLMADTPSAGAGTSDVDMAGNAMFSAYNVGNLTADTWTGTDWVGADDTNDFYTFTLDQVSNFDLTLSGLSANADVTFYGTQLVWNKKTKSYVETLATLNYERTAGTADETISRGLAAGTYYVQVTGGDTEYTLDLAAENLPENGSGNSMDAALDLGNLTASTFSDSDWVGSVDTDDFYTFTLDQVSNFDLTLSGLSANADVTFYGTQLVYNKKTKSYVETLATLNYERTAGTADETISRGLAAGTYYVQVTGGDTEYTIDLAAENLPENGSGNSMDAALDLGNLTASTFSGSDWVGSVDTDDFYTFTLDQVSNFDLTLSGLSANADVTFYGTQLVYNKKTKSYVETLATLNYERTAGTADETISRGLAAGTYYVQVTGGDTAYDLDLTAVNLPENGSGNTMDDALDLGNLTASTYSGSDWVGSVDTDDFYTFTLDQVSNFDLTLSGLSANADVTFYGTQLVYNKKTKSYVETLATLNYERTAGTADETISRGLAAGTYYVQVTGGDTAYDLDLIAVNLPENGSGNTMDDALDLGNLTASTYSGSDWVGSVDTDDFYTFTLDQVSNFGLTLSGLSANGDVTFYGTQEFWNKKTKQYEERLVTLSSTRNRDASDQTFSSGLAAGTYYVQITGGDTGYDLNLTAETIIDNAGQSYGSANDLGSIQNSTVVASDWVGTLDAADYYLIHVAEDSEVTGMVTGLSGDVTMSIYNGHWDLLRQVSSQNGMMGWDFGADVASGYYYCVIRPARNVDTEYTLTVNARTDVDMGYTPQYGTAGNDVFKISGATYTLGGDGDDMFVAKVAYDEPIALGGSGADTYYLLNTHANLVVGDFGSSAGDTIKLPNVVSSDMAYFSLVDSDHLTVWFERMDQTVTILNWRSADCVIETIELADMTISHAELVQLSIDLDLENYNFQPEDLDNLDMTTDQLRNAVDYAEYLVGETFPDGWMTVGSSADDLVVAQAGLGVATGAGDDILFNEIANSQGWLNGESGDDTYIFSQGVHTNLNVHESSSGSVDLGNDVIEIYGDERINSIAEDLTFSWNGADECHVSLTVDGGASLGEITILGMADSNTKVETLRLYANGELVDSCTLASS